jgi:hypothetical protein
MIDLLKDKVVKATVNEDLVVNTCDAADARIQEQAAEIAKLKTACGDLSMRYKLWRCQSQRFLRQLHSYRDTEFHYKGHKLLVQGVTDMELAMFKKLMHRLLKDRNMHLTGDLR